jgi:cell division protein FtsN
VQLAAIDQFGLYNLKDFLPAQPTAEGYQAISEMFAASVDGELYDPAKWGNFYKPYGVEVPSTAVQATSASAQAPAPAPVAQAPAPAPVAQAPAPAPVAEAPAPAPEPVTASAEDNGKKSADDILAMIRNRQS